MKRLILLLALGWSIAPATIRNSDGTAADTATQITACVSGDTVLFPASGSFTWNSTGVTVPSTKGIIIDLNGSTITQGTGTSILFTIETNAVTGTRLTNGTINLSATPGTAISISTSAGSAASFANIPPRIDHMTISCPHTGVLAILGKIYFNLARIDHCTISGDAASEMIQNHGYSTDTTSNLGWTVDIVQGSSNAVYIEDCTFSKYDLTDTQFRGCSSVQNYYGARLVFRNNTLNYCQFDVHGTAGHVGGRWWEYYNNNFVMPAGSHDQSDCADLRAGSGVLFGQTRSGGTNTGAGNAKLREEDTTGYPALWQIGRGKNTVQPPVTGSDQALDPVYCWNNDFKTGPFGQATYVVDGRDFYSNTVKPGYQPYKYPFWGAYPVTFTINTLGTTATLVFDSPVDFGAGGSGGLAISPSGGACTLTYASGRGTNTWIMNTSRTILGTETFSNGLSYAQPTSGLQVPASGTQQTLTDVGSWPQSAGSGTFFAGFTVTNSSTAGAAGSTVVGGNTVLTGNVKLQ